MSHVMKVSQNGQVSIPAEARARWRTDRVIVVDLGDRVVMRPVGLEGPEALIGKYAGSGVSSDRLRARSRAEDARKERDRRR
jgi:bifunctional DNA-binding transcriptional regulator/antitoxin component of YhaV-PrlF toxin-antitoxin module